MTINKLNGKCYIGSHSTNIDNDLYLGSGILIKKAIKKYGRRNFIRIKLKLFNINNDRLKLEEYYIKLFDSLSPNGYNISPTGGYGIPNSCSIETRRKLSIALKGRTFSKEHRKKLSISKIGSINSLETRKKLSQSLKGRISPRKNVVLSEEIKEKISISKRKNPVLIVNHTEDGLERIRQAMKSRIVSKETKEKMSNSLKGRIAWNKGITHSTETKEKMSLAKQGKYIGENNNMFGKSPYDIWVIKYGIDEANNRKRALYEKRSKNIKDKKQI